MEEEDDAANLESFLQWATEVGISDSDPSTIHWGENRLLSSCLGYSVVVSHFPDAGGRGLAAARDIRKGELILRVPKGALMTSESLMMKDQTLLSAVKRHPALSSTQILGVALLNEVNKGKSSWWYPYLKQLPSRYDILASFGQFEIQALQMDDAIWIAEKAAGKAKLEWKETAVIMAELRFKPALLTLRAWLWASATISSRTMHIPWDDAGCLCPVGDFFNYAAPGDEPRDFENSGTSRKEDLLQPIELLDISAGRLTDAGYECDIDSYCFYARRNYKEKEQVLLSYGMYNNLELLEHYGFLLDDNPNDKAFIPLEPDIYSLCSWSKELLYIDLDGKPSFALLSTVRLWATPANQRRSIGHIAYSGRQLSAENEITVMAGIVKKCHDVLENLTTSAEQDRLLLRTINTIHDSLLPVEFENLPATCIGELRAFFKSNGMTDLDDFANACISRKVRRSMFRWKLAVNWRFNYKTILTHCITHCTRIIDDLRLKKSSIME